MTETADPQGNLRITLRLHPAVVQVIDDLNDYIPQGDRADMVRFLMNLGMKQLRLEQTAREQADVLQKMTSVMSDEFTSLANTLEKAGAEKDQKQLAFPPAPRTPAQVRRDAAKRSGSSSTGTKSQK